ncbi:MAG: hypothetical protein Q8S54_01910 [Bacteroidota bacterium]|nr:hypothetical protein [Odoribacter sp.]MDP3641924.1 hypothetical protein [Bacteroidota bacterium]
MTVPLYSILKEFCPSICELIGEKNEIWNKISVKYISRINYIKNEVEKKGNATFSKMFLDNWLLHKIGDEESNSFLKYIDKIVAEILNQIPRKLHGKLRTIVKQVIGNFDNEDGKRTTNGIGEIFVIDYYLKRDYSLGRIEVELPDMKPIDFLFRNNKTGEYLLLEVINIHPDNVKIKSKDGLTTFFIQRYLDKFKDKSKNNLNNAVITNLKLFPIIWTDSSIIKDFGDFFIDTSSDFTEEIHLLQGLIVNGTDYHYFLTPVSKLI